ncbi:MAG TPA: ZIP family metal transporter [Lacipirellulaceae bacterium]|nr:ZIP family metal transporter [Lacipirellulaceae bacterium]
MSTVLLAYYCALVLVASIIGGMIPVWFQLTHRWMQIAISFVAGVMLGIGVLHMLPHAIADATAAAEATTVTASSTMSAVAAVSAASHEAIQWTMMAMLVGMLTMFFIERFFSYHHHDVSENGDDEETPNTQYPTSNIQHPPHAAEHSSARAHRHDLSWGGATFGLALHSIIDGVALAAAVQCESGRSWLAGFGAFLVIFLHKPFDAMTVGLLMSRGGWSLPWRHTVNTLFSLAIPVGVLIFYFGLMPEQFSADAANRQWYIACALAFSAGTFLCISLSDLLPELQFHRHDRVMLSIALLAGLAVAQIAARLEAAAHPPHQLPVTAISHTKR